MSPILIAPFSNSGIRDWPSTSFRALVGLMLEQLEEDNPIMVIGTANQKLRANEIVRNYPTSRVVNACGRLSWSAMVAELRRAACVVGNNSGVAHLGGYFGVPTVCIFGASHQRHEWRALGPSVVLVTRSIGCSPCQLDHGQVSPYDKACLRQIEPQAVARAAFTIMKRVATRRRQRLTTDEAEIPSPALAELASSGSHQPQVGDIVA